MEKIHFGDILNGSTGFKAHGLISALQLVVMHIHLIQFRTVDCLVLENLTCKYRYPCIMDLKMGTRSYSDDDNESEKRRKTTYARTTSHSLGTRLCGMQVSILFSCNTTSQT